MVIFRLDLLLSLHFFFSPIAFNYLFGYQISISKSPLDILAWTSQSVLYTTHVQLNDLVSQGCSCFSIPISVVLQVPKTYLASLGTWGIVNFNISTLSLTLRYPTANLQIRLLLFLYFLILLKCQSLSLCHHLPPNPISPWPPSYFGLLTWSQAQLNFLNWTPYLKVLLPIHSSHCSQEDLI